MATINRCSVEGLQLLWHGSAFFRPVVRCALFQRSGVRDYVRKLNESNKLRCVCTIPGYVSIYKHRRYLTPAAIALAKYRVLVLGRDEVPNDVVSAGNIRLDFETAGTVASPRGMYIRRRKPPIPHNKAGNINNALFSMSVICCSATKTNALQTNLLLPILSMFFFWMPINSHTLNFYNGLSPTSLVKRGLLLRGFKPLSFFQTYLYHLYLYLSLSLPSPPLLPLPLTYGY